MLLLLSLACQSPQVDWSVFVGDVEAEDVPGFCDGYGERTIAGNLSISKSSLTDLRDLSCVDRISGYASIGLNPALRSLHGLENLSEVQAIRVILNPELVELAALHELSSLESLELNLNEKLESIDGLESITRIETDIYIGQNASLRDLDGFDGLVEVGEGFQVILNAVEDVGGLHNLASVGGRLGISDEPVESLEGLSRLSHAGEVQIGSIAAADLRGLEGLESVEEIHIQGNDQLTSLSGLENLAAAKTVSLVANSVLPDLSGLESLATVGYLQLVHNHGLVAVSGAPALVTIHRDLWVLENERLADLSAFHPIQSIGDDLIVQDNPSLPTAEAESLRDAIGSIGGEVTIQGNAP